MKKAKCLVICTKYPYPPSYGLKIAIYQFLSILRDFCNVHLVVITDENNGFEKFRTWAEENGFRYTVFLKSRTSMFLNAISSIFSEVPVQVAMYSYKDVENRILEIIQNENVELVIPFLIRTAPYAIKVKQTFQIPVLMAMVDSISLNYKRLSKDSFANPVKKAIINLEAQRLEKFERFVVDYFDKTYLVSKEEKKLYKANEKIFVLPNYVDDNLLAYDRTSSVYSDYVVFFGKMDYQPNIDAVLWFLRYIFPYTNSKVKFGIIGPNVHRKIIKEAKRFGDRVKIFGFVEDPYVILRSSAAVVAPMRTGAGIQNKVLEAMAVGSLVILSSIAAAPVGGKNGIHYIVEDSPENFVKLLNDVFENPSNYSHIRKQAREFIRENFSRITQKNILKAQLMELMKKFRDNNLVSTEIE